MRKTLIKDVFVFALVMCAGIVFAAEPWAAWSDFTGLTGETPKSPDKSSTQNNIAGSGFTFNLGCGRVNADGSITTTGGSGSSAPYIDFHQTINTGYAGGENPVTIVATIEMPQTLPTDVKPLWMIGNGSKGIGLTLTGLSEESGATFGGAWNNGAWNSGTVNFTVASIKPQSTNTFVAGMLQAQDNKYSLMSFNGTSSLLGSLSGLRGTGLNSTRITFGNYHNTGTDTMTYRIINIAIFRGKAVSDQDIAVMYPVDRELTETQESWNEPGKWSGGIVPYQGQSVSLMVNADSGSTMTLDQDVNLAKLAIGGSAALCFAGSDMLSSLETIIDTDTDASAITASLGAVEIAEGKTLKGKAGAVSLTDLSGAGTFEFGASAAGAEYSHAFNASWTTGLKWTLGDLVFDAGNNGTGYPKNAPLTVTGADARIILRTSTDTTGYNGGSAPLTIENGATLLVEKRDTFNRTLVLDNGNVVLGGNDLGAGRSFDLFTNSSIESHGTSTIGGRRAATQTGILAIRRANFTFDVADGTLSCYSQLNAEDGFGDVAKGVSVKKTGEGTLALYRGANHNLPVSVEEGTLSLTGDGKMTLGGTYTVAEGATLELKDGAVLTNDIALAGNLKVTSGRGIVYGDISGDGTITIDGEGSVLGIGMVGYDDFTGTVVLTNKGAIVVPAGFETNHVIKVDDPETCYLALRLDQDQMFDGYTARPPEGVTVKFYSYTGTALPRESVNGNVYTPNINIWDDGVWMRDLVEGEDVVVLIDGTDQRPIHVCDEGMSLGIVKIEGVGTASFLGGKLTATKVSFTTVADAAEDATVVLTSSTDAFSFDSMFIGEGATLVYTNESAMTLPALTGTGTFSKFGTGRANINPSVACEPSLVVNEGMVALDQSAEYSNTYNLTLKNGGTMYVNKAAAMFTSESNVIRMEGGSRLKLENGNTQNVSSRPVRASIIVSDSTDETPAVIDGSYYGNGAVIEGSITGNGVLSFEQINDNNYTVSATIKDSGVEGETLKIKVSSCKTKPIVFSGANTFTGGFEIAEGATVKLANPKALGEGVATIYGTLSLNNTTLGTRVSGPGTITATSGAVRFSEGGAIVPYYGGAMTLDGTFDESVVFDVFPLIDNSGRRFDIIKAASAEALPSEAFMKANLGRRVLKDWKLIPAGNGIGWALQTKKFGVVVQ